MAEDNFKVLSCTAALESSGTIFSKVRHMANLVQGIFQGLPVKAPHSPVTLPFRPDEQAGTGC